MSRIFVTGGSGRLGRSVVAGLAQAGHEVVSVDRDAVPAGQLPPGVVQETADLLAPGEALRLLRESRPDAVIHLAAIAVPFSAPRLKSKLIGPTFRMPTFRPAPRFI